MDRKWILLLISIWLQNTLHAQTNRWQQKVMYKMDIDVDAEKNILAGTQHIQYFNQSPDRLKKIFIHLYWNAFQPNSMMDARSRYLGSQSINDRPDWDPRVRDRILNLKPEEIGFQKIKSFKMNGVAQPFIYHETILEVNLKSPIAPHSKVTFDVEFEAQVPLQVRRAGRDNPNTGVKYSMSQWYPKICEYDEEGWHPTPYIAREFYGVWGDFDVNIRIDKQFKLGGTGQLINASEIGWGYDAAATELKPCLGSKRNWHFIGKNIHDFVWAADTGYKHIRRNTYTGGPLLHFIYKPKPGDPNPDADWIVLADAAVKMLPFMEQRFGKYAYPQYSFIQGGDGGMEYPMATLIAGPSLGTAFHEWMHSWYQMMLATNESLYPWMDEGFTNYGEDVVMKVYKNKSSLEVYREALRNNPKNENVKKLLEILPEDHADAYAGYFNLSKSGLQEPLSTHADHYESNYAYGINSYSKGEIFLAQLGYIIGDSLRDKVLLEYYNTWKFKHPNANDFVKLAQDVSGIQLDWYKEYWVNTTKTINYGIDSLWEVDGQTKVRLRRINEMPMPIDVKCDFKDGGSEMHIVPLNLMFGNKPVEDRSLPTFTHDEWRWTHPTYVLTISRKLTDLTTIEIDPSRRMADVERKNNKLSLSW